MTKEKTPKLKAVRKLTETTKDNNNTNSVNCIFPPQEEFSSDGTASSNSIKKDIKNIIETFGSNTKQDRGLTSSDDTLTSNSSQQSGDQNNNKTFKVSDKHVSSKDTEQNVPYPGDSMLTESSDLLTIHDFNEVKHPPPLICRFCHAQTCPASGVNRTCNPISHCNESRNCCNSHPIEIPKQSQAFGHGPELQYTDPIYKQHRCYGPSAERYINHNCNQFRYHKNHEYLKPKTHIQCAKINKKYSQLKQHPSVFGSLVNNVGQWYNNLKHDGDGDREELCCHPNPERQLSAESLKLYRAKIEKNEDSDPDRITFNKVTGIPKYYFRPSHVQNPTTCQFVKCDYNTQNNQSNNDMVPNQYPSQHFQDIVQDGVGGAYKPSPIQPERIDVYYFDHGNSGYYRTTDRPPPLCTEILVERTDEYATKFWAEVFGACHIVVAFVTTFILQLFRFFLYSVIRPLLVGFVQLSSDYFFKPLLTILFNGLMQPIFILLYNVATSFRDLCEPIAKAFGFFLKEIAQLLKAIRLVDVNTTNKNGPFCYPHASA